MKVKMSEKALTYLFIIILIIVNIIFFMHEYCPDVFKSCPSVPWIVAIVVVIGYFIFNAEI